jgi:hypothetical protein
LFVFWLLVQDVDFNIKMEELEKELYKGNRVFLLKKHCIFGKGEGRRTFLQVPETGEGGAEILVE